MKDREKGGRALTVWESARCKTSVFVMSLSQSISLRDRAPPSGVIAWWPASIGVVDLVPSRLILEGEGRSKESDPPSTLYIGCMRKEEVKHVRRVCRGVIFHPGARSSYSEDRCGERSFLLLACSIGV